MKSETRGADSQGRRTVLVTGATGAVGPSLVARLLDEGYTVRLLSRGGLPPPWNEGRVEHFRGDVCDSELVARAVAGVDWIFHLASLLHIARPGPNLAEAVERVNVEGTRVVVEESKKAAASRLVFFSTIAVYGPTDAEGADETSPPRPDTLYGRTKLKAEDLVKAAHSNRGLATTTLRLAAVYGPHVKGNYARLAAALRAGWFVPIGSGLNRRTLVHEKDVANAALLAAERPEAAGGLYNVSDGQVHTLRDIIEEMCGALDRRPPRLSVPAGLARAAGRIGDAGLAVIGSELQLSATIDKYTEDVAVRAERIQHDLEFRPQFDLEAGWRDALRPNGAKSPSQALHTRVQPCS